MTGLIEVKLTELNQLFNSMDPSPFHERDLDHDAEEFIVSWAQEHPKQHDLKLLVHLAKRPPMSPTRRNSSPTPSRITSSIAPTWLCVS
jgi:hypothetical protein